MFEQYLDFIKATNLFDFLSVEQIEALGNYKTNDAALNSAVRSIQDVMDNEDYEPDVFEDLNIFDVLSPEQIDSLLYVQAAHPLSDAFKESHERFLDDLQDDFDHKSGYDNGISDFIRI